MFRPQPEDWKFVTDPHWRSLYVAPQVVLDSIGVESTVSQQKVCEVLLEYIGEMICDKIAYRLRLELLPFLGDRELKVELHIGKYIEVSFDDDNGRRSSARLNGGY